MAAASIRALRISPVRGDPEEGERAMRTPPVRPARILPKAMPEAVDPQMQRPETAAVEGEQVLQAVPARELMVPVLLARAASVRLLPSPGFLLITQAAVPEVDGKWEQWEPAALEVAARGAMQTAPWAATEQPTPVAEAAEAEVPRRTAAPEVLGSLWFAIKSVESEFLPFSTPFGSFRTFAATQIHLP